jgi:Tol biopolymer transport system component
MIRRSILLTAAAILLGGCFSDQVSGPDIVLKQGTLRKLTAGEGVFIWPDWSPDGEEILFADNSEGSGRARILKIASGGGEAETFYREPNAGVLLANPRWIPDSPDSFAFLKTDQVEHTYSIYLAGPGVDPVLVFETDRWSHSLDVTLDGAALFFYSELSVRPNIMRYDLQTKILESVQVDSSLNTLGDLSCDPAGDMISFTMYEPEPGLHNLFRLPLAGGGWNRITTFERDQFSVVSAELAPDGDRYLILTSQRIGKYPPVEYFYSINLIPVSGGDPHPLVEFPKPYTGSDLALRAPHNPTWSPDGGSIAFDFAEAGDPGRNIYVMDL